MQAIVYHTYGSPDVLNLEEVPPPLPADDEVLVKVRAASVNSWDWDLLRGTPLVNRLMFGLFKPQLKILGCDIAGTVEAVGKNVKRFQPGDAVFGDISGCGWGGFAEVVAARADVLASKPAGMTFEQAAAIPQAGVLALQGLRYKGQIEPGQTVLINGAGGGVGTFAIQIAKSFGAEVTGVDSPAKLETMRAVGVDHVIDYTQDDYTQSGQRYDLILDNVARRSIFAYRRALNPGGVFVIVGGSGSTFLQTVTLGTWFSKTGDTTMGLLMHKPDAGDLAVLAEMFEAGQLVPVIDQCFPLAETAAAIRALGEGRVRGKAVITLGDAA